MNIKRVSIVVLVLVIAVLVVVSYRRQRTENLSRTGLGYDTADSSKSAAAVRELSRFRDQQATELLLKIAESSLLPDSRETAIFALANRRNATIASRLVEDGLQPHNAIATRKAISVALQKLSCPEECIRGILHYRERIWQGQPNFEDQISSNPSSNYIQEQQAQLTELLNSVLIRENPTTLKLLMIIYGLGTANPSVFALKLIEQLHFQAACSELAASYSKIQSLASIGYKGPRSEIESALRSLNCTDVQKRSF
jgi:hypothetical protein